MANLGQTPVQVTSGVVSCGRCGAHIGGKAAGAVTRARYNGPELAAVVIRDGLAEDAEVIHRCQEGAAPAEGVE